MIARHNMLIGLTFVAGNVWGNHAAVFAAGYDVPGAAIGKLIFVAMKGTEYVAAKTVSCHNCILFSAHHCHHCSVRNDCYCCKWFSCVNRKPVVMLSTVQPGTIHFLFIEHSPIF